MNSVGIPIDGEEVLWSGAPDPAQHLRSVDWFLIPFSIAWTGGLTFIIFNAEDPGVLGWAVTVVMCAAGVYLMVGRFFAKAAVRRRTRYVLTNRRAVIEGPRRSFTFAFTQERVHIERWGEGGHSTFAFSSDDPRTYGKISLLLIEDSGLDVHLRPGSDTRFKFTDVIDDGTLRSAIGRLVSDGTIAAHVS